MHTMKLILAALAGVALAGPARAQERRTEQEQHPTMRDQAQHESTEGATVQMKNSSGKVLGTLRITDEEHGIGVKGTLTGLPRGDHGVHFHMTGKCEPGFESAGEHWNPTNKQHGTKNPNGPHLGDIPNLTAQRDGTANLELSTEGGDLSGEGDEALLDGDGAALVIHANPDDYVTDPSGGSGSRIACGVVTPDGA